MAQCRDTVLSAYLEILDHKKSLRYVQQMLGLFHTPSMKTDTPPLSTFRFA